MLNSHKQETSQDIFLNLAPDDRANLVDFFALLLTVDKRTNPALYKPQMVEND